MKTLLLASAIALISSSVIAAPGGEGKRKNPRAMGGGSELSRIVMMLRKADANGDLVVDLEEWNAGKAAAAEKLFDRLDSDEDGQLTLEEFDVKAKRQAQREERAGEITRPERPEPSDEVKACLDELRGDEVSEERPSAEQRFNDLDSNSDGVLDSDEFAAVHIAKSTEQFDRLDSNDDDVIDANDVMAFLQQKIERKSAVRECRKLDRDEEA